MPLGFTGDLFLGHRPLPHDAFSSLVHSLPPGTQLCVNFESTVVPVGRLPTPARTKILLDTPESSIRVLDGFPMKLASLGNNHIGDYGNDIAEVTRRILTARCSTIGAGLIAEPFHLCVETIDDISVGFASYCTSDTTPLFCTNDRIGARPLNLATVRRDIAGLKKSCRHAVAMVHWGIEDFHHPRPALQRLGRILIDLGFTVVVGHHSHTTQGYEQYGDGWIFYSLGNLYFSEHEVHIGGKTLRAVWLPRRSWGLIPIFEVSSASMKLESVHIVRHERNSAPQVTNSPRLRRIVRQLNADIASPGYLARYRKKVRVQNYAIRWEEFIAKDDKFSTILSKLARFMIRRRS